LAGEMWMFTRAKVDSKGNIVGSHTIMDKVPKTELLKFNAEMEPLFTIASMPIAKVFLTVRPRLLKAGKLYAIEEDEEGFLTVKHYRIDWK